jgi:hypothetical protein
MTFDASGPDAAEIGRIAGWSELPPSRFAVSGGLHWKGFPIAFDRLRVELGDTTLALDGVLGAPPRLLGTDLRMRASGPSTAPLASLAGLDLPPGRFRVDGRLVRVDGGVRLEGVVVEIGESALVVDGLVGDPPELAGTDLTITARGPDLSTFGGLAGAELPAGPFEVAGRLAPEGDDVVLHGVRARLGGSSLAVEGRIAAVAGLLGTDLRVRAEGPGLAWLEPISGLGGLPDEPYRVEGGVGVVGSGYRLRDVRAELGGTTLEVDGLVGRAPGLTGTELAVHAAGPDLSRVAVLAGLEGLPGEPFELRGGLRIADGGYELTAVSATVGGLALALDGSVGSLPTLRGTVLRVAARTSHLAVLQPFLHQVELPDVPVSAEGRLRADPDGWWIEGLVVDVGDHTVEADGLLSTAAGQVGTWLDLSLVGPDLSDLGRLVTHTGLTDLPELPAEPYAVTGALTIGDGGYGLHGIALTLGRARARVDGTLGRLPTLQGTDLVLDVDGPDASLFTSVTGVTVPVAPFRVRGRARRLEKAFRFDRLLVQLGEYHVMADGVVGEPPALVGTDLAVEARGPSLALVEALGGPGGLPDQPFELTAHLDGDPLRFRSDDLSVRLGASDVRGSFRLDLSTDRPVLHAKLASDRIDVTEILADRADRKRAQAEPVQPGPPSERGGRVIPDRPLELGVLRGADADVVWSVDELVGPAGRYQDLEIDLELEDGRLEVGPLAVTSSAGGHLGANLVLEPGAGAAYTLRTELTLANARLDLTREEDEDHALQPSLDADLQLTATGASLHELASTADGSFIVALGEGQVDSSVLDLITADIVLTLLDTLNPFTSGKKTTTLQCAVVVAAFDGGVVTLEPMAVQTAKMTLLGDGRIDLATERLALDWVTKPRKGFGLSASTVTNPYFRLGGSLARPNLEVKPLEAMTATGIAVATGGMSILGKGLLDRITAGRKVCRKAIRKAERRYEERLRSSPMGSRSPTGR